MTEQEIHDMIPVPTGNAEVAQAAVADLQAYGRRMRDEIAADAAKITADNYTDFKINAFDAAYKDVDARMKAVATAVALQTHLQEIMVQATATIKDVKAAAMARADVIRGFKRASEPPVPSHPLVIQFAALDGEQEKAIIKYLEKNKHNYRWIVPTTRLAQVLDEEFAKKERE